MMNLLIYCLECIFSSCKKQKERNIRTQNLEVQEWAAWRDATSEMFPFNMWAVVEMWRGHETVEIQHKTCPVDIYNF